MIMVTPDGFVATTVGIVAIDDDAASSECEERPFDCPSGASESTRGTPDSVEEARRQKAEREENDATLNAAVCAAWMVPAVALRAAAAGAAGANMARATCCF